MKWDEKNVFFSHAFLLCNAPLWGLSERDDKLVIYLTCIYVLTSCKTFGLDFSFLVFLLVLQSRIAEMSKTSMRVKVETVDESVLGGFVWTKGHVCVGETMRCTGSSLHIVHGLVGRAGWILPPTCLQRSCSWSELSNNWQRCLLGKLLHFVFWLIGCVYTSVPASRLPTLVCRVRTWTIWSRREDSHMKYVQLWLYIT